jgi:hypothetical protein
MQVVKLKSFKKFDSTVDALTSTAAIVDSKLPKGSRLQVFLDVICSGKGNQQSKGCCISFVHPSGLTEDVKSDNLATCLLCRPQEIPQEEC